LEPVELKCEKCGLDLNLPFKCNYCEHYYCPEHRLPESHDCSETWRVKALRSARIVMAPEISQEYRSTLFSPRPKSIGFGQTEKRHLLAGTALVTGAGISFFLGSSFTIGYAALILATVLFSMGFILHELAHKYVAQAYGLWAEFRLNLTGVLLIAISMVSPLKFIAPGAVVISGFADRDKMGRTAVAGPIVNVLITAGLLAVLPALRSSWMFEAVLAGASINSFLAVFNLIPFAIFDGRKVYLWNRKFWAMLFVISLGMTIYTNFILHPF
jgi:Zn-dependent protease